MCLNPAYMPEGLVLHFTEVSVRSFGWWTLFLRVSQLYLGISYASIFPPELIYVSQKTVACNKYCALYSWHSCLENFLPIGSEVCFENIDHTSNRFPIPLSLSLKNDKNYISFEDYSLAQGFTARNRFSRMNRHDSNSKLSLKPFLRRVHPIQRIKHFPCEGDAD